MAFKNGLSERLDELRFPSPRSPPSEPPFPGYTALSPGQPNLVSALSRPSGDVRANLHRRFTTDSSKVSSWNNHTNQSNGAPPAVPDPLDLLSSTNNAYKTQLMEKKRQHIEYMREQRRRFEEDMKLLDMQHEKEKQEMDQLARDLARAGVSGPVSEPTTPPESEYRENGVPAAGFARPTRFSTSSVTSSPGFFNVFAPSQAQVTSPTQMNSNNGGGQTPTNNRFSVHSVPGSRRNSEKDDFGPEQVASPYRSTNAIHRYSMPTSSMHSQFRSSVPGFNSNNSSNNPSNNSGNNNNNSSTLESFSAAKYLFPSEEENDDRVPTPDVKSYLKLTEPDDKFPTLFRRNESGLLSANSDALDIANSRTPQPEAWSAHNRHRASHQSMPQNALNMFRMNNQVPNQAGDVRSNGVNAARRAARQSLEGNMYYNEEKRVGGGDQRSAVAATSVPGGSRPTSLQSSYSTNDLPTVKDEGFDPAITPPKTHADIFPQQNAHLGRTPTHAAVNGRQPRGSPERDEQKGLNPQQPPSTSLHASAAPFGPQLPASASNNPMGPGSGQLAGGMPNSFYGYGMQPYLGNPMQMNGAAGPGAGPGAGQIPNYPPPGPYGGYPHQYNSSNNSDGNNNFRVNEPSAVRAAASVRRSGDGESSQLSRFTNFPLEHYRGELYSLCKDQHGCRYLQRKLEERNPEHVQMIFDETYAHVVELMTDPFGNYLCQKLLEYSNDEQRTALINSASPELVKIALNQHGTRALQKMIEFISTSEQTRTVIRALENHVVELVQDLNGNHVIQKCLNRLSAEDAQFVYDAVGTNCVVVGTHRHGCCVLQRCIDHASGDQRARLIAQITSNAFSLVQDPFGNYVVQYILDLAEPLFTEPLCQSFRGHIPALSKQKFSSNVIEKCLRTADVNTRRMLVDEMLSGSELEKMLRDSFANYVVQTAMDFSDADTRGRIVDSVRPILPLIRQTPHGRRIAGKIMAAEGSGRTPATANGQVTAPNEMNSAQLPGPLQPGPGPGPGPGPKQLMYQQNPFGPAPIGPQFGHGHHHHQSFAPAGASAAAAASAAAIAAGGSSSGSNASSAGASDNSSGNIYTPTALQPNGNFGGQGQMYSYF